MVVKLEVVRQRYCPLLLYYRAVFPAFVSILTATVTFGIWNYRIRPVTNNEAMVLEDSIKESVGVALAAYNGEHYIARQLDSILSQSVPPDKVVVVDDGSTDETLQILEDYAQKMLLSKSTVITPISVTSRILKKPLAFVRQSMSPSRIRMTSGTLKSLRAVLPLCVSIVKPGFAITIRAYWMRTINILI